MLVEAKLHKNPIKRELVQVLYQKVQSAGAHKGVMVSTAPHQTGAVRFAQVHGIALATVTEGRFLYEARDALPTPQLSRAEAAARLGYPTFISHYDESGDKMGSIRVWSLLPGDDEYTRDVRTLARYRELAAQDHCSKVCGCAATDELRDAASSSRSQHPSSSTWLTSCLACNSVSGCGRESPGSAPRVVTQLVTHQPGGRGIGSLLGTAPAAPPPTNAMRAGLGGGVPTGAVAATRARHGFGTVVLGAHSGRSRA